MKEDKAMVVAEDRSIEQSVEQSAEQPVADAVTPEQERAIALMVTGKTVKDTALEIGVNRATLFRWMRHDPAFVAAWNAWRREQHQAVRAQLLGLSGEAVAAVRAALGRGDGRIGLALLKGMGMLAAEQPGSEEAQTVRREMDLAKRNEEMKLKSREVDVAMEEGLWAE